MDDRYGTDVLAAGWRQQHAKTLPRVAASRDARHRGRRRRLLRRGGRCGFGDGRTRGPPRPPAILPARTRLPRRRAGRRPRSPGRRPPERPGAPHPVRSPSSTHRPASRARAGSSWRDVTTPNSSRRSGGTTCGPKASSSSTCRASICWRRRSTLSRPRPSAAMACSSTTSSPAPRSPASRTRSRAAGMAPTSDRRPPWIDVWQCVTPQALGIARWPEVPRGIEFKVGVCRALGWPAEDQADIARAWQRILARVTILPRPGAGAPRTRRGAHRLRHRAADARRRRHH